MKKHLATVIVAVLLILTGIAGISAEVVSNPELPQSCGVDMVLVIDSSGSINSTELAQMKDAYEVFVNAFLPATPTLIGVVDFDTQASVIQGFTNNVSELIAAVNAPVSGGYTNWQDALLKAHGMFDPRTDKPDLVVFASDGNPNRRGSPAQAVSEAVAVQAAVQEANSIKSDGIRIIALGIGDNVNTGNLEAISSPDAVITSDFGSLAEDLANLAAELCGGTITVKKTVDSVGVPGWEFSIDIDAGTSTPPSGLTDSEGFINFDIEFNDSQATVDVIETVQTGYVVDYAVCKIGDVAVGTFDGQDSIDNISIGQNDIVSCEFANVLEPFCGDGVVDEGEVCDEGNDNTDIPCSPPYGSSCSYCDTSCQEHTVEGPFCGDGIKNGPEECDGTDGVGENQVCTYDCKLETTDEGCVLTQGYWKNHDWPDSYQKGDTFFGSGLTWFEMLKTPPKKGDAYIILAHQYIAYKLNQGSGASLPGNPAAEAEGYFSIYNPGEVPKVERHNLIELSELLDDYNNGLMSIPHCDD